MVVSRGCMAASQMFWIGGRDGVVSLKLWHHVMSSDMSHRYWNVTDGHEIWYTGLERTHAGHACFRLPKMVLTKSSYVNSSAWGRNGAVRLKIMTSYYVTGRVTPVLKRHHRSQKWKYMSREGIARSYMLWIEWNGPREAEIWHICHLGS